MKSLRLVPYNQEQSKKVNEFETLEGLEVLFPKES